MNKKECGEILRYYRNDVNHLSVSDVSKYLVNKNYKAGTSTVYSWEDGNSFPSPDILLELCVLYGITDVLKTFKYKCDNKKSEDDLITKISFLDEYGKNNVLTLLKNEVERCTIQNRKNVEAAI